MPIESPTAPWKDRRLIAAGAVVTVVTFALDLRLPLGVNVSALYASVVLLGLFIKDPRFPVRSSVALTVLTVVGAWLSPPGGPLFYGLLNRAITLPDTLVYEYVTAILDLAVPAADGNLRVLRAGEIVVRRMGNVSVTFDHRVVDGVTAAAFCLDVIARLQSAGGGGA